jgi:hypothetical protein
MQQKENAKMVMLMADAHLQNIQSIINDLEKQKENLTQEINKLNEYLRNGIDNLKNFNQYVFSDSAIDESGKKAYYLGE